MTLRIQRPSPADLVAAMLIVVACMLRAMGQVDPAFFLLAMLALLSPANVLRAIFLGWIFLLLNPGLFPSSGGSVGRFLLLFAAAGSVLLKSRLARGGGINPFIAFTIGLGFFFILHGFVFSPMLDVTMLRAAWWSLATATVAGAWMQVSPSERLAVSRQLYFALVLIMLASVPLLSVSVGRLVNGTGFQGITNQPQVFGMVMALLATWSIARLFAEPRPPWHLVAIVACAVSMIFLSETRTAGAAMLISVGIAVLVGPWIAGRRILVMLPGLLSRRVWLFIGIAVLALLFSLAFVADALLTYLTKSDRAEVGTIFEAYDISRGGLIRTMLANIERDPFGGIGFGIASDPRFMVIDRDPLTGLPMGAPMEKGVAPLAVLEETGVFGSVLVAAWLIYILRSSARNGVAQLAMALVILLLNLGEATLFSPGGFGLGSYLFLFWACFCPSTGALPKPGASSGRPPRTLRPELPPLSSVAN